jgi:hypothetical protein
VALNGGNAAVIYGDGRYSGAFPLLTRMGW